jgi:hypothetical protein
MHFCSPRDEQLTDLAWCKLSLPISMVVGEASIAAAVLLPGMPTVELTGPGIGHARRLRPGYRLVSVRPGAVPAGRRGELLPPLITASTAAFGTDTTEVWRERLAGSWFDRVDRLLLVLDRGSEIRSVPLMDDAARQLDLLSRRDRFVGGDDLVFCDELGGALAEDVLRKALYAAMEETGIDRKSFPAREGFTFHDLRHTFGTLAAQVWPLVDVQAYMGHADIQTTMRYLHYVPREDAAARFTEFVRREKSGASESKTVSRTVSRTAEISDDLSAPGGTEYVLDGPEAHA